MNFIFLSLLFLGIVPFLTSPFAYHPRRDLELAVHLDHYQSENFTVKFSYILIETHLHPDTVLCVENLVNSNVSIKLWNFDGFGADRYYNISKRFTEIENHDYDLRQELVRNGLGITVTANDSTADGVLIFKRCRRDVFTTLVTDKKLNLSVPAHHKSYGTFRFKMITESNETSSLVPFTSWDNAIHVPFDVSYLNSTMEYVDFSTIMPRRFLRINDWTRRGFCLNFTINDHLKIEMSRCRNSQPFTIMISRLQSTQVIRYWEAIFKADQLCPIDEESRPDYFWLKIISTGHVGVGDLVFFNCHHFWIRNHGDEDYPYAEKMKIVPTIDKPDGRVWSFDYVVSPNRRNPYFSPAKHLIDTALVTGTPLHLHLEKQLPHTLSFSACYNSPRYPIKLKGNVVTIEKQMLQTLSDFTNIFDCEEEKTVPGFYISVGADKESVMGNAYFYLDEKQNGAETPEGKLKNDMFTTVAFNLKKGNKISRNVDIQRLVIEGLYNSRVDLHQYFNCTGLVQLSISRCEFSPKLQLFNPMKSGSAVFDSPTLSFIEQLYNRTDCLTDFQMERGEYFSDDRFGVYLHIEALEDSVGYVALYESFSARMNYYELTEEYEEATYDKRVIQSFHVFNGTKYISPFVISHLINRAQIKPAMSLRFFVDSNGPLQLAISECKNDEIREWKTVGSTNGSVAAWYTFDKEGLELLSAFSQSLNCFNKRYTQIFVHIKSEANIYVNLEFSIWNGTDLNQVSTCDMERPESLQLKNGSLQQEIQLLLVEIAMVVVIILGFTAMLYISRRVIPAYQPVVVTESFFKTSSVDLSERSSTV
ncbi:hypothetical protein B9Z55_023014 [Caenorhabditis nigoni]|nr:hypothetical protein B9Z55_023014 [Caenorhabditis nigoni]